MTIIKYIKIEQTCTICKRTVNEKFLIIEVPVNFSVSTLLEKVKKEFKKIKCEEHPFLKLENSFSFFHKQVI